MIARTHAVGVAAKRLKSGRTEHSLHAGRVRYVAVIDTVTRRAGANPGGSE